MKDFNSFDQEDGKRTADLASSILKAYAGKSEKEVYAAIYANAEQGKREGTLTNDDLDNFYRTVAPMLDGFKRQKLKSLIDRLKEV